MRPSSGSGADARDYYATGTPDNTWTGIEPNDGRSVEGQGEMDFGASGLSPGRVAGEYQDSATPWEHVDGDYRGDYPPPGVPSSRGSVANQRLLPVPLLYHHNPYQPPTSWHASEQAQQRPQVG